MSNKEDRMATRRILVLVVGLIAGLGFAGATHHARAQGADIKAVVNAYKQAFAAGDLDATFATMDDNISVSDLGNVFTNKADWRAYTVELIKQSPGLTVAFGDTVYVLDTAVQRVAVSWDSMRAAGIDRIWVIETIVVSPLGKIVSYSAVPDVNDAQTLTFVMASAGH
jgi:hypothetical protein